MLPANNAMVFSPNPANPARAMVQSQMEIAQQVGLLGPCSFDDCDEFADARCAWKNTWRLSNGGCDELFCDKHAYIPKG